MINMNNTHRLAAAALATITMLGLGGTTVSASTEPPTIDQIGAQYVSETGATSVACSQYDADVICYGLLDGAVIAGVWADGVFTPFEGTSATGESTPIAATPTGVTEDHPDYAYAVFYVLDMQPDLEQICPMWESDPQAVLDGFRETVNIGSELDYLSGSISEGLTASYDEMKDLVVIAYGNRLERDCA